MVLVELTWHWWKPSLHMALVEPIGKSSFLEISSFLGDLGPDRVTGRLGWLEWVEPKEIAAWDDWNQLPSNSRSSSTPAPCHLADVAVFRYVNYSSLGDNNERLMPFILSLVTSCPA